MSTKYVVMKYERNFDPEVAFQTNNEIDALSVCNAFNRAALNNPDVVYKVFAEYEVTK